MTSPSPSAPTRDPDLRERTLDATLPPYRVVLHDDDVNEMAHVVRALLASVSDVAVIGLPDAERGERCCAVVVIAPGAASLDFEEMLRFLKDQGLLLQKLPEQLESLPELPRNPTGKVLKQDLRRRYGDDA